MHYQLYKIVKVELSISQLLTLNCFKLLRRILQYSFFKDRIILYSTGKPPFDANFGFHGQETFHWVQKGPLRIARKFLDATSWSISKRFTGIFEIAWLMFAIWLIEKSQYILANNAVFVKKLRMIYTQCNPIWKTCWIFFFNTEWLRIMHPLSKKWYRKSDPRNL